MGVLKALSHEGGMWCVHCDSEGTLPVSDFKHFFIF